MCEVCGGRGRNDTCEVDLHLPGPGAFGQLGAVRRQDGPAPRRRCAFGAPDFSNIWPGSNRFCSNQLLFQMFLVSNVLIDSGFKTFGRVGTGSGQISRSPPPGPAMPESAANGVCGAVQLRRRRLGSVNFSAQTAYNP